VEVPGGNPGRRTQQAVRSSLGLRRANRRVDARRELTVAYELFSAMGMRSFAERTRRELLATGETVHTRNVETRDDLAAQEAQIVRLARDGLSNP
jgi:hypothetical protein